MIKRFWFYINNHDHDAMFVVFYLLGIDADVIGLELVILYAQLTTVDAQTISYPLK